MVTGRGNWVERVSVVALILMGISGISTAVAQSAEAAEAAAGATAKEKPNWPRELEASNGGSVTLYQPQIESWDSFTDLRFRLAAEFRLPGNEQPIPAALDMKATTTINREARTVTAFDLEVIEIKVPTENAFTKRRITQIAESRIAGTSHSFPLDDVLAHFELAKARARPSVASTPAKSASHRTALQGEAPPILVSKAPAILVLFDGKPIFLPIKDTSLEFAVNTNWDVFLDTSSSTYYLLDEDAWLKTTNLTGAWIPAGKLPKAFSSIPSNENFSSVLEHVPGRAISKADTPRVIVSYRPAELILLEGEPVADPIPGTDLVWITNTDSDLFRDTTSGLYYYLVSGRWFQAATLDGPWSLVGNLPKSFAAIPADHPAARVRVSVPGTPEAEEAVMLASVPQQARISRSDTTVVVRYDGEPEFRLIDGTSVYYATNTSFDVFRVGTRYYACFEGIWFVAASAQGPWAVTDSVPAVIYEIPPTSPKYHVTYVYVYDSTPDYVIVGHTPGYQGVYVYNGVVVYGTGWYYPPYVYYPPYGYPVYRAYPHSYGMAAYYNPNTGTYGRGAAVYGPYGGAGWGAAYNPSTGTYARGISAWGPYEAGFAGHAYNPRTDTYGATYQRGNTYANWGETVVSRGDDWVHTGYYADSEVAARGIETSQGARAGAVQSAERTVYAGRDADNNVYAGSDGNVYRRDESGWSSYDDGEWSAVEQQERKTERSLDRQANSEWGSAQKSGRTLDSLERDWQARELSSERSKRFDSRQRNASKSASRSRGGRRRGG